MQTSNSDVGGNETKVKQNNPKRLQEYHIVITVTTAKASRAVAVSEMDTVPDQLMNCHKSQKSL